MRRYRLDKRAILKKSREFDRVFRDGFKRSSEHILVFFMSTERRIVGFAVSKKIKGAVARNRAKRRLRELVRLKQDELPEACACVFFAKPGFERVDFGRLEKELLDILAIVRQHRKP